MSIAWPDKHKSFFNNPSTNSKSKTWCYLEWLNAPDHLTEERLASEFKRSGDSVVRSLLVGNDHYHPDGLFLPVCYLYRHSLELMLKSIIRKAIKCDLLKEDKNLKHLLRTGHELEEIWMHVLKASETAFPGADHAPLDNVGAIVAEFHRIDKDGCSLRYRLRKDALAPMDFPKAIDLVDLANAYQEVYNFLDGILADLENRIEYIAEMNMYPCP